MDTLYLILIIGIVNFIRVSARRRDHYFDVCIQPNEDISMFFNDKIANGGTYVYKSGTNLTVTCKSEKESNSNVLTIVRTYNLQQNHDGTTKNIQKNESIDDGSSFEISHTFDLSPNDNGVKISCVWKNNGHGVSTILILKLENLAEMAPKRDKDFESTSFTMGIGVGAAMTIFFGLLCWLVTVCYQFKQPRPKLATPLPEGEYSSVYSWWRPAKRPTSPQPSKPLSDIFKALNIIRFTSKPELPSQHPPNVTQNLSNCKVPPKYTPPSLPPPNPPLHPPPTPPSLPPPVPPIITQSSQNARPSPKPALPSQPPQNVTQGISNLILSPKPAQPPPDITQGSQNLRLPPKPALPFQLPLNVTQAISNLILPTKPVQPPPNITRGPPNLLLPPKPALFSESPSNATQELSNLKLPPKSKLVSQPPPDIIRSSRNVRLFPKPTLPLQPPANVTQTPPNPKLTAPKPFPDITQTSQSLRFPLKFKQQSPDARKTPQNLLLIPKPSLSPCSPDIVGPKFSVSKMHISKLESIMGRM